MNTNFTKNPFNSCRTSFIVISLIIILISPVHSIAQIFKIINEIDAIEVMAGPSYVNQLGKGRSIKDQEVKIEYAVRLGLNYKLGKKVWLKNYFSYEKKGFRNSHDVLRYDPTIDVDNCKCTLSPDISEDDKTNTYFTFSPVIIYHFTAKLFLGGGPYVSKLLKSNYIRTYERDGAIYNLSNIQYESPFDWGSFVVVGYNLRLAQNINSSVSLQHLYGFTNSLNYPGDSQKRVTSAISFMLGIQYVIPKPN